MKLATTRRARLLPALFATAALPVLLACSTNEAVASAGDPAAVDEAKSGMRVQSLSRLADLLEQMYVFPDIGLSYADWLRASSQTLVQDNRTPEGLAAAVTGGLLDIHKDGHLRVEVREQDTGPGAGPGEGPPMPPPTSLKFSRNLGEGIHYIRLDSLWGDPQTMAGLGELVSGERSVDALVVDLRNNRGGGLQEMDFLFSHLMSEPTDLLVMEIRRQIFEMEGSPFGEGPTTVRIDSPETSVRLMHRALPVSQPRMADTEVILLTSPTTGSAAEHFALAMKATGRGTLIGQTTRGAGHFGGIIPLGDELQAFIPAGRTYDHRVGKGWEGRGVSPDLEVEADTALVVALEQFGIARADASKIDATLE